MAWAKYKEDNYIIGLERWSERESRHQEGYLYIARKEGTDAHRRCIDGRFTGSNKCVGYCDCYLHRGYLTKELRKQHNCLVKECGHYVSKK